MQANRYSREARRSPIFRPRLVVVLVAILAAGGKSWATPGDLDATFGSGGSVVTGIEGGAKAIVVRADGKILVGGTGQRTELTVMRFDATGALDSSFGSQGISRTSPSNSSNGCEYRALAEQPDGRFIAGGKAVVASSGPLLQVVARYLATGTLDPTFGQGGFAFLPNVRGTAKAVVIQPDGSIVTAGTDDSAPTRATLVRYDANGVLDPAFGIGGIVAVTPPGACGGCGDLRSLILLPNGQLIAGGTTVQSDPIMQTYGDFFLARFNGDGSIDPAFGINGFAATDFDGGPDELYGVVRQPDGKLVAGGYAYAHSLSSAAQRLGLARYQPDGSLDPTFGVGGLVMSDIVGFTEWGRALVLQLDGKLILGGTVIAEDGARHFLLARYDARGRLDSSFGLDGVVSTRLRPKVGVGGEDALALQPDGKVLLAGGVAPKGKEVFTVARFALTQCGTSLCGDGIAEVTCEPCDDGNAVAGDGCDHCSLETASVADGSAVAGIPVTTDDGSGATSSRPLQATVTIPPGGAAGPVSITIVSTTANPPAGSYYVGGDAEIVAPAQMSTAPLRLTFGLDGSLIPVGQSAASLQVFHDASVVADCLGETQALPDDPCVTGRVMSGGDAQLTVLTSTAGVWNFGVAACPPIPRNDCRVPTRSGKAKLALKNVTPDDKDQLLWAWGSGSDTPVGALGDPHSWPGFALCVYDATGGILQPRLSRKIPSAGYCDGKSCWKTHGSTGFQYRNDGATPEGVRLLSALAGMDGKAKLRVKGQGVELALPTPLAIVPPVVVQLEGLNGECWGATYSSGVVNTGGQFKAKSD